MLVGVTDCVQMCVRAYVLLLLDFTSLLVSLFVCFALEGEDGVRRYPSLPDTLE